VPKDPDERFALGGQMAAQLAHLPNQERRHFCLELERLVPLPDKECANRMLGWSDVQTMAREGITFGSHTLTHPNVAKLSAEELDEELATSKEIMERRMGMPVHDFSFPFGRLSENGLEEAKVLRRLGYRTGVTSAAGLNKPGSDCFTLRRSQMVEGPGGLCGISLFAFRVEKAFLRG